MSEIRGRPNKLSKEVKEKLYEAIGDGQPIHNACILAGIHKATYYNWQVRANRYKTSDYKKEDGTIDKRMQLLDKEYYDFFDSLEEAWAKGELEIIKEIRKDTSLQAKIFILERRRPKDWGRITSIDQMTQEQKEEKGLAKSQQTKRIEERFDKIVEELLEKKEQGRRNYNE